MGPVPGRNSIGMGKLRPPVVRRIPPPRVTASNIASTTITSDKAAPIAAGPQAMRPITDNTFINASTHTNTADPCSKYKIGSKVRVREASTGTLLFLGETGFAAGSWCGIALDEPSGKNNGSVNGIRYFVCAPNHGVFVRPQNISAVQDLGRPEAAGKREGKIGREPDPRCNLPLPSWMKSKGGVVAKSRLANRSLVQKLEDPRRRSVLKACLNATATLASFGPKGKENALVVKEAMSVNEDNQGGQTRCEVARRPLKFPKFGFPGVRPSVKTDRSEEDVSSKLNSTKVLISDVNLTMCRASFDPKGKENLPVAIEAVSVMEDDQGGEVAMRPLKIQKFGFPCARPAVNTDRREEDVPPKLNSTMILNSNVNSTSTANPVSSSALNGTWNASDQPAGSRKNAPEIQRNMPVSQQRANAPNMQTGNARKLPTRVPKFTKSALPCVKGGFASNPARRPLPASSDLAGSNWPTKENPRIDESRVFHDTAMPDSSSFFLEGENDSFAISLVPAKTSSPKILEGQAADLDRAFANVVQLTVSPLVPKAGTPDILLASPILPAERMESDHIDVMSHTFEVDSCGAHRNCDNVQGPKEFSVAVSHFEVNGESDPDRTFQDHDCTIQLGDVSEGNVQQQKQAPSSSGSTRNAEKTDLYAGAVVNDTDHSTDSSVVTKVNFDLESPVETNDQQIKVENEKSTRDLLDFSIQMNDKFPRQSDLSFDLGLTSSTPACPLSIGESPVSVDNFLLTKVKFDLESPVKTVDQHMEIETERFPRDLELMTHEENKNLAQQYPLPFDLGLTSSTPACTLSIGESPITINSFLLPKVNFELESPVKTNDLQMEIGTERFPKDLVLSTHKKNNKISQQRVLPFDHGPTSSMPVCTLSIGESPITMDSFMLPKVNFELESPVKTNDLQMEVGTERFPRDLELSTHKENKKLTQLVDLSFDFSFKSATPSCSSPPTKFQNSPQPRIWHSCNISNSALEESFGILSPSQMQDFSPTGSYGEKSPLSESFCNGMYRGPCTRNLCTIPEGGATPNGLFRKVVAHQWKMRYSNVPETPKENKDLLTESSAIRHISDISNTKEEPTVGRNLSLCSPLNLSLFAAPNLPNNTLELDEYFMNEDSLI